MDEGSELLNVVAGVGHVFEEDQISVDGGLRECGKCFVCSLCGTGGAVNLVTTLKVKVIVARRTIKQHINHKITGFDGDTWQYALYFPLPKVQRSISLVTIQAV